jgi:hypothetical protein
LVIERALTDAGIEFRQNKLPLLKSPPADPKKARLWIPFLTTKSYFHEEVWSVLLLV